jgi:hypothetical protein
MQISNSTSNASAHTSSGATAQASSSSGSAAGEQASSVKSFACGAIGLDNPDAKQGETNQFYTAGKIVAAAVTIGKLISLFV